MSNILWRITCNHCFKKAVEWNCIIVGQVTKHNIFQPSLKILYIQTYLSNWRRILRSPTSCLVAGLTRCQIGSSCRRIIASKDLKKEFSRVNSSTSTFHSRYQSMLSPWLGPYFLLTIALWCRRTSDNVASMHSTSPCWIWSIFSVIGCRNSTTSAFAFERLSAIRTWNLA